MQLSGTHRSQMLEALHSLKLIQKQMETVATEAAKAGDVDLKTHVLDLDALAFVPRPTA